jgi:hypothetical protein
MNAISVLFSDLEILTNNLPLNDNLMSFWAHRFSKTDGLNSLCLDVRLYENIERDVNKNVANFENSIEFVGEKNIFEFDCLWLHIRRPDMEHRYMDIY